jgi:hypothetical protein
MNSFKLCARPSTGFSYKLVMLYLQASESFLDMPCYTALNHLKTIRCVLSTWSFYVSCIARTSISRSRASALRFDAVRGKHQDKKRPTKSTIYRRRALRSLALAVAPPPHLARSLTPETTPSGCQNVHSSRNVTSPPWTCGQTVSTQTVKNASFYHPIMSVWIEYSATRRAYCTFYWARTYI